MAISCSYFSRSFEHLRVGVGPSSSPLGPARTTAVPHTNGNNAEPVIGYQSSTYHLVPVVLGPFSVLLCSPELDFFAMVVELIWVVGGLRWPKAGFSTNNPPRCCLVHPCLIPIRNVRVAHPLLRTDQVQGDVSGQSFPQPRRCVHGAGTLARSGIHYFIGICVFCYSQPMALAITITMTRLVDVRPCLSEEQAGRTRGPCATVCVFFCLCYSES